VQKVVTIRRKRWLGSAQLCAKGANLHRVSEKNCANFFLSELRVISTNFGNFWQKDGKEAKLMRDALNLHFT